jgi:hypothetical protein
MTPAALRTRGPRARSSRLRARRTVHKATAGPEPPREPPSEPETRGEGRGARAVEGCAMKPPPPVFDLEARPGGGAPRGDPAAWTAATSHSTSRRRRATSIAAASRRAAASRCRHFRRTLSPPLPRHPNGIREVCQSSAPRQNLRRQDFGSLDYCATPTGIVASGPAPARDRCRSHCRWGRSSPSGRGQRPQRELNPCYRRERPVS